MRRLIKPEEKEIIKYLLAHLPDKGHSYIIPFQVTQLDDGGMGSIQLSENSKHHNDLIQMEYVDIDGQKVFVTLTENEYGELFDLDIWKVDFSPLKQYPTPEKLKPVF